MKADVAVLRAVERRHGGVSAEAVLTDAAAPDHPWHNRFQWDDRVAGRLYRLDQARDMIRRVRFEIVENEVLYRSCAYVRDPGAHPSEQGYASVARLRNEKTRAREALLNEFLRVAASLKRARDLAGTLGLIGEIDTMIVSVEGLANRVRPPPRSLAA
jgi:hypothetical protein